MKLHRQKRKRKTMKAGKTTKTNPYALEHSFTRPIKKRSLRTYSPTHLLKIRYGNTIVNCKEIRHSLTQIPPSVFFKKHTTKLYTIVLWSQGNTPDSCGFVHWVISNVQDPVQIMKKEHIVLPYLPPSTSDQPYFFGLFEQNEFLLIDSMNVPRKPFSSFQFQKDYNILQKYKVYMFVTE